MKAGNFTTPTGRESAFSSYLFVALVVIGIIVRLAVVIIPGNALLAPWSGGNDGVAYITLAQNIVAGQGFSYHGFPSAFRPPIYPLTLAACFEFFSANALRAMRVLQFFESLGAAFLCAAAARRVFGKSAGRATLVIALFFPMLVALSGEIQTETLATLVSAAFLYLLVRYVQTPGWGLLLSLGVITGVATLVRPNMALFGFILVVVIFFQKGGLPKIRAAALAAIVAGPVISPWVVRNEMVFHGEVLLSTQGGLNAGTTMVTPRGRTQVGDAEELQRVFGWIPPLELETNGPMRLHLGSEPELNRQGWDVAKKMSREAGWGLVPMELKKISNFWLGTDQLFSNSAFRLPVRLPREGAVVGYWILLIFAIVGWLQVRVRMPFFAPVCLSYVMLVTALHLPFAMNTRIGVPFIDPWVAALRGRA